tara:strand:+ start:136 stop:420 length:285 start_codon:yes stop_codon:yes gene_type:complete
MKEFKAYGNWVAVVTKLKEEHTTEQGIIYKDALPENLHVWSEVYSIGDGVSEDIKVGDKVYWKLGANAGAYYTDGDLKLDLVEVQNILLVESCD